MRKTGKRKNMIKIIRKIDGYFDYIRKIKTIFFDYKIKFDYTRTIKKRFSTKIVKKPAVFLAMLLTAASVYGCAPVENKETLRTQAIEHFEAGDYETAYVEFQKALDAGKGQVSPFQYDVLQYRGECELRLGKYEDALKTYTALLDADRSDEVRTKKYQDIVDDLSRVDAVQQGMDQMGQGQYDAAYTALSSYAALDGSFVGKLAWFNKAVCAEYLQRYDEAYELFQEYLKMYPDDASAQKEANFLRTR